MTGVLRVGALRQIVVGDETSGKNGARTRVLIVDPEREETTMLELRLAEAGHGVVVVRDRVEAIAAIAKERFQLIVSELELGGEDGYALLAAVRAEPGAAEIPFVFLTRKADRESVARGFELGAADFLVKPVSPDKARAALEAAIRARREERGGAVEPLPDPSPAMRPVLTAAERVSRSMVPVLLLGETGTGKEWLARRIVAGGARADRPFVAVNCGALPRDLTESILFGFERGAFTGAERRSPGKFAEADGGTLFLDEIGDLAPDTQVKLLRALQEGEIDPIGAARPLRVDLRIIAATHRDLRADVEAGRFREDLFYRLDVFPLALPPLRERREEIPTLARLFAARHLLGATVSPEALERLSRHLWPGNIRELENAVRRAAVMAEGPILGPEDFALPDGWTREGRADLPSPPLEPALGAEERLGFPTLAQVERAHILRALQHCGGQPSKAAKLLRIGRTTLYRKLRDYGVSTPESGG